MQQTDSPENLLACTGCKQPVGIEDKGALGCIRLFKWSLALQGTEKRLSKLVTAFQRSKDGNWKMYSTQRIFTAQLLALIEELAIYKFLLQFGDDTSKDALLVSVISSDGSRHVDTQYPSKR